MTASPTIIQHVPIDIKSDASVHSCEQILAQLPAHRDASCVVRLASQFNAEFFSEIWATILLGTICRQHYSDLKIIAWGHREAAPDSAFTSSLPGLSAIQMSDRVTTDTTDRPIDIDQIEFVINRQRGGLLEPVSGKVRTLIEFDPQSSIAPRLQGRSARERAILFKDLILTFRKDLEFGYKQRNLSVQSRDEIGVLSAFLGELHDNAFRYSRTSSYNGLSLRGLRFVRIRAHLALNKDDLVNRARNVPVIKDYLRRHSMHGIMEASVSDFGSGIVDHFLESQHGALYADSSRRELLQLLVHDPLSSSSDPAAGYGLPMVLRAARKMSAFVSLRTAEFWLAQSFSDPEAPEKLVDVLDSNGMLPSRPKVAGTHWQFLWPAGT